MGNKFPIFVKGISTCMNFIVKLPCTPLVEHFLKTQYGTPCRLKGRSGVAKLFYRLLERPSNKKSSMYSGYKNSIDVFITENDFERFGCELTRGDIMEFNNMVTDHIYELMSMSIVTQEENIKERTIKESIFWWCDYFDFPQEVLSFDAAKKAYYRYRQRLESDTED